MANEQLSTLTPRPHHTIPILLPVATQKFHLDSWLLSSMTFQATYFYGNGVGELCDGVGGASILISVH